MEIPAVSVIIAMYNTGKYIGECLESILNQTFQNFEVIVIDDCSTDNSATIVENYAEKFGKRLKLLRLEKNSGNNGIPNNKGLTLSRGEYVIFLDSDDTITLTALEKLYSVAKDFNADVVACEKYYQIPEEFWNNAEVRRQIKPFSYQTGEFVTEPTLIPFDIAERVKDCRNKRFLWNIWSKLIRRDFLIGNEITITNEMANDMLLTCFLVFSAPRYVRVPFVINFYRVLNDSLTHKKHNPLKKFEKYLNALTVGFEHLNKFLNRIDFFQKNSNLKYVALEIYLQEILSHMEDIYSSVPVYELDETLQNGFAHGNNFSLAAFTFNIANIYRMRIIQAQQKRSD